MPEANLYKVIENVFNDKVTIDVENMKNNTFVDIPDFIVDQLIMKFGLKTLAVKHLIMMRMGLQDAVRKSLHKRRDLLSKIRL